MLSIIGGIDKNGDIDIIEKIEDIIDDEIMTVRKVAAYFKVSDRTALKLIEDGEISVFYCEQILDFICK
ncbi:MAG TPA: helix-turn-helix domain-containing protein [Clostridium sp.]|uniref:helix-turn-helix domain-containing protein n=1 Tax=Clostridium TaxID=1485 RepID=UPI001CF2F1C2|nr:helix-turn-helix domain-containing protein [Clostridium algoriphilum]MCB2292443.1 helix-turn-helix domain-containing protein [Clostridium algoriphilum]